MMQKQNNPWVDNLVGLYQNSIVGNADNRGLDSAFARESYIETALDAQLLPAILEGKFKAVFLTGNPGDGKTAFLEKVYDQFMTKNAEVILKDTSGWHVKYSGREYISCYDASESFNGVSSDDRLLRILKPLAGDNEPKNSRIVLIAINDGKLHSFFHHQWSHFRWLSPLVLEQSFKSLSGDQASVVVVNLKDRALIDISFDKEESIFDKLLQKFTNPKNWEICKTCSTKDQCPIYANAAILGCDPPSKQVRSRLKLLFALSHIRRRRHNTIRDIRSALSFIVTNNKRCSTIHEHVEQNGNIEFASQHYYNSIFVANDEVLAEFQELDPACTSIPRLDRLLAFMYDQKRTDIVENALPYRKDIRLIATKSANSIEWIASMRRLLFFEAESQKLAELFDGIQESLDLLPYRHLHSFLKFLQGKSDSTQLKQQLARGISQMEGIRDNTLFNEYILIRVTQNAKEGLTICRKFPIDDFEIFVNPNKLSFVEGVSDRIIIRHVASGIECVITMDVFELLMRMSYGLLPGSDEQQVVLDEIAEFKSRLHRMQTRNLMLIESSGQIHQITQDSGRIIRSQEVVS